MKLYSHLFVALPVILGFCAKQEASNSLAKIGNKVITQEHYDAFQKVNRMYPSMPDENFPGERGPVAQIIQAEIIASKAGADIKSKIEKSADWQLKKKYYPAQFYLMNVLAPNLGISDEELNKYYTAHKDSFKVTISAADSTKKDSVYTKPFEEVKAEIVNILFYEKNKPDSVFLKMLGDTLPPEQMIKQNWIQHVKGNLPQFFMKSFYKAEFGKNYPDSINEIFGTGKLVTPDDLKIITSWIPESRRDYYNNENGKKELVEWLLKWKLFSGRAEKSGYTKSANFKYVMEYALKNEIATEYVKSSIVTAMSKKNIPVDTLMTKYAILDDNGSANLNIDTAQYNQKITFLKKQGSKHLIDSCIYSLRMNTPVTFINADWNDGFAQKPADMLRKADSLRDSANTNAAEEIYNTLVNEFIFLGEGKKATIELAKIQTEKQMYHQALANYRKYILLTDDQSKLCNIFFMIGFIYDEYLDKPDLAEINYKYVLKNAVGCDLADDAEFMMLHLGEPMSSVEELQAEAVRQGRPLDTQEE
jgi:hypothetical protein